jgi:hypothetical protein
VNRIQRRIKKADSIANTTVESKEYDYEKNLNWRDDGDEVSDPCMNDFLKGYQVEPYEFKQWASKKGFKIKTAAQEQINMHYFPEYLADYILTLWNGADGPLQNFFEGFTLRYDNKMKLAISDILKTKGFEIYPTLTDDKPRYAKLQKIICKVAASKNLDTILTFAKLALTTSDGLRLCMGELEDLQESGCKVSAEDAAGLLNYYQQIYPEDFAIQLITNFIEKPKGIEKQFEHFKDYSISDESLNKIEDYMSGNSHPMYTRDGGNDGWNFTTDSRGTDSTAPGLYEMRESKKKN